MFYIKKDGEMKTITQGYIEQDGVVKPLEQFYFIENGGIKTLSFGSGEMTEFQAFDYSGSIVLWTVPDNVREIRIECWGAQGGNNGGRGAMVSSTHRVSSGENIEILVGGQGAFNESGKHASGGGGSFIAKVAASESDHFSIPSSTQGSQYLMVAAGGGAGRAYTDSADYMHGTNEMNGLNNGSNGNGSAGGGCGAGGGAGAVGDGYGVASFVNGGGEVNQTGGGFGGGGYLGIGTHSGGSGGGGFNGGYGTCSANVGYGGTSFNSGREKESLHGKDSSRTGHGYVVIHW